VCIHIKEETLTISCVPITSVTGITVELGSTVISVIDADVGNHVGYFFKLMCLKTPHKPKKMHCTISRIFG